tara:strand:+ start:642 stop:803 length:162 start_codon:yes stop_codon:yes gene_type:complete
MVENALLAKRKLSSRRKVFSSLLDAGKHQLVESMDSNLLNTGSREALAQKAKS